MAAKVKHAPEAEPQSAYNSIAGLVGDWIRQGTEGFVATQKILLDLTAQQNALAITIIRERVGFSPPTPKKVADFAGHGVKTLLDVQRRMLDLVVKQNSILHAGLKPLLAKTPINFVAEVAHQGLDNLVSTQKEFLDIVQSQTDGAVDDFGEGKYLETGRLAELAREGMSTFLEGQKKFLDILQEQIATKARTSGKSHIKELGMLEMAKQSVDAIIETQQGLLDLASEQVKANVSFAREMFSLDVRPTAFSDVVKKSVDSFVAAQKALADLAAKPRTPEDESRHSAAA